MYYLNPLSFSDTLLIFTSSCMYKTRGNSLYCASLKYEMLERHNITPIWSCNPNFQELLPFPVNMTLSPLSYGVYIWCSRSPY